VKGKQQKFINLTTDVDDHHPTIDVYIEEPHHDCPYHDPAIAAIPRVYHIQSMTYRLS